MRLKKGREDKTERQEEGGSRFEIKIARSSPHAGGDRMETPAISHFPLFPLGYSINHTDSRPDSTQFDVGSLSVPSERIFIEVFAVYTIYKQLMDLLDKLVCVSRRH
jgi:hypothetical protein